MYTYRRRLASAVSAAFLTAVAASAMAASHSDAPLIKQDPQANLTDVYAFVGTRYDDPSEQVLNVVVNVRPFSEPGDGVIYDRFADDALYSIHITDPSTGVTNLRYDFRFSPVDMGYKNLDTILSYGLGNDAGPIQTVDDDRQNYTQTYRVTKTVAGRRSIVADGLLTPPPNVGVRTTPAYNDPVTGRAVSGAASLSALDSYTRDTLYTVSTGEAVFAGPREDGFYADTPAIFDLLDTRILDNNGDLGDGLGQDGNGVDGFKGFNVLTYGVQIPLRELSPSRYAAAFADLGNSANPVPRWPKRPASGSMHRSAASASAYCVRTAHRSMPAPGYRSTAWAIRCSTRFWSLWPTKTTITVPARSTTWTSLPTRRTRTSHS